MNKKKQLQKHKYIATGLFLLMVLIYIAMLLLSKNSSSAYIGYTKAFAEAGMIGALADWFAVTALFKYPLGIKIPHTNLIYNNKDLLGKNLGLFVTDNFLNQETIRPYITKINFSSMAIKWLNTESGSKKLSNVIKSLFKMALVKLDDNEVIEFINKKAHDAINEINIQELASNGMNYAIENNEHQRLLSLVIPKVKHYVVNNKEVIYKKVVEKNPILGLIGGKAVTNQLISGMLSFLEEIEKNENHNLRNEITIKLLEISEDIKANKKWEDSFNSIKMKFTSDEKFKNNIFKLWKNTKYSLIDNLNDQNYELNKYIEKHLIEFSLNLEHDKKMQEKINKTIHKFIYKLALRNSSEIGTIISKTINEWDGKEMSEKLELEVGKDLQFIRINGTLVGGFVGLIIYAITNILM